MPVEPSPGGRLGETIDLSGRSGRLELIVRYGSSRPASSAGVTAVKRWQIRYIAHDGRPSSAFIVLPSWYGPAANPPLPLVISPHGRGLSGRSNSILWGNLPGRGSFAVVNPDARGRRVAGHSWGYAGQIADLARMPEILRTTLPWLRIDRRKVYAFGGSMGGQETLLLVARHPKLLAGAAAFSAVTDMGLQYRNFTRLRCNNACRTLLGKKPFGASLRELARREMGGGPGTAAGAYAARSPITLCPRDRALLCAAAALVERRRPDRRRPAVAIRQVLLGAPPAERRCHGRRVRRLLDPLRRDASAHGAPARALAVRAAPAGEPVAEHPPRPAVARAEPACRQARRPRSRRRGRRARSRPRRPSTDAPAPRPCTRRRRSRDCARTTPPSRFPRPDG